MGSLNQLRIQIHGDEDAVPCGSFTRRGINTYRHVKQSQNTVVLTDKHNRAPSARSNIPQLGGPLDHAGRVEELRQSAMPQRVKWQKRRGCMKKDKVTQFLILLQHGYFLLYHYIQENMKRDKGKLSLSTTHNTLFPLLPNIYRWIKGAKEWKDWVCICYP